MTVEVVPIIYDDISKKILRWYLLDYDYQLNDDAFKPQNSSERSLLIPLPLYKAIVGDDPSQPLLHKLQDYVRGNTS